MTKNLMMIALMMCLSLTAFSGVIKVTPITPITFLNSDADRWVTIIDSIGSNDFLLKNAPLLETCGSQSSQSTYIEGRFNNEVSTECAAYIYYNPSNNLTIIHGAIVSPKDSMFVNGSITMSKKSIFNSTYGSPLVDSETYKIPFKFYNGVVGDMSYGFFVVEKLSNGIKIKCWYYETDANTPINLELITTSNTPTGFIDNVRVDTTITLTACGIDSTHIDSVYFNSTNVTIPTNTGCDSVNVFLGGNYTWFFTTTSFLDTTENVNSATIATYNIVVNNRNSTFGVMTSCNPLDTGVVSSTKPNQFGCDSIHTITTTLLPSYSNTITSEDTIIVNGNELFTNDEITFNSMNGCDSVVTYIFNIDTSVVINGIQNIEKIGEIYSYSNTIKGNLIGDLFVTDITGKLVKQLYVDGDFSFEVLNTGIYIIHLINNNNSYSTKIVVR